MVEMMVLMGEGCFFGVVRGQNRARFPKQSTVFRTKPIARRQLLDEERLEWLNERRAHDVYLVRSSNATQAFRIAISDH